MIKHFIDKVEDVALRAMLKHMDSENDARKKEIENMQEKIDKLKDNQTTFDNTRKVVEAYTNLSKVAKKSAVTAAVGGIIAFILYQIGLGR